MIKETNKFEELKAQLEEEGKVYYYDKPRDLVAFEEMDKSLEETRREYRIKEKKSHASAAKVFFTA